MTAKMEGKRKRATTATATASGDEEKSARKKARKQEDALEKNEATGPAAKVKKEAADAKTAKRGKKAVVPTSRADDSSSSSSSDSDSDSDSDSGSSSSSSSSGGNASAAMKTSKSKVDSKKKKKSNREDDNSDDSDSVKAKDTFGKDAAPSKQLASVLKSGRPNAAKADKRRVSFNATPKTHILEANSSGEDSDEEKASGSSSDSSDSDSDSDGDNEKSAPKAARKETAPKSKSKTATAALAENGAGAKTLIDDEAEEDEDEDMVVPALNGEGIDEEEDDDGEEEETSGSDLDLAKPLVSAKPFRRAKFKTDVGEAQCVLATFPQGQAPDENKSFGFFKTKRTQERVLYSRGDGVEMEGREGETSGRLRQYLAFRFNPATGEAVLLNASTQSQCPIAMHNTVRKLPLPNVRTFTEALDDEATGQSVSVAQQRRRALIETFGAAKRRKDAAALEMNRISSGAVTSGEAVRSMLMEKAKENPVNGEDAAAASRKHLLPPYHEDATRPEQIYLLQDLLSKPVLRALKKPVEDLVKASQRAGASAGFAAEGRFGSFVMSHLERISAGSMNKKAQKAVACAALYTQYLLNFSKMRRIINPKQQRTLGADLGGAPPEVAEAILYAFAEPELATGSMNRTKLQQDRLALHIIALALILCGCVIDYRRVKMLAQDLSQTPSWIIDYAAQLGTRTKTDSTVSLDGGKKARKIVLEVPLRFPRKIKRGR